MHVRFALPIFRVLALSSALLVVDLCFAQEEATEAPAEQPQAEQASAELPPEVKEAIERLKTLSTEIEEDGENLEKLSELADLYLKIGDAKRAVLVFDRAISQFGGTEEMFMKFSRVLALSGRPELSLDVLNLGLESFAESEALQLELGRAYLGADKPYAALAKLKGLRDNDPENPLYNYYLADAYRLQEKFEKALELLDQAIELDESFLRARLMKADVFLAQTKYDTGTAYLEEVLADNPDSDLAKNLLVQAYQLYAYSDSSEDRFETAEDSVRRALEIDPENAESNVALGAILQELGEFVEAETILQTTMEKNPEYLEGYMIYGKLLESLDRAGEASLLYQKGLAKARELDVEPAIQTYRRLLGLEK